VAASGFFTGSYNLFATNVIAPSLAYIYWNDAGDSHHERDINVVTLTGSLVGMLLFGHYADRYGRKTLYGWELVIVIVATIGMAQSSEGFRTCSDPNNYNSCRTSMSIYRWITFWRFVLGVGVGAEYPMSATIGVEWSSRQSRARMLAAIFMMQPLGQLLAFVVGIAALKGFRAQQKISTDQYDFNETAHVVDSVWRCVIGVGAIPATFAILARLSIPETPRYTLFIEQNDNKAHKDAVKVYGKRASTITSGEIPASTAAASGRASQVLVQRGKAMGIVDTEVDRINPVHRAGDQGVADEQGIVDGGNSHTENMTLDHLDANRKSAGFKKERPKKRGTEQKDRQRIQQFTWIEMHQFFIREGNWRLVAGTSLCWFILDVGFYGLGLNNPRIISKIWMDHEVNATMLPVWNSDFQIVNATIYEVLEQDAKQSIILVSIGSLLGSILFWKLVKYVPRSSWLVWSFMLLSILFAIAGGTFIRAYQKNLHVLTIALYILAQLLFNLGKMPPNSNLRWLTKCRA
jgi:PHS family inorganic phosphate transporter-like MFS transporter